MVKNMEESEDEQVIGTYTLDVDGYLGRGLFGPVIKARKRDSSDTFAIKKISKLVVVENNMAHEMKTIVSNIRTLHHKNIVTVHDILMSPNNICLCMDYVDGQKLVNIIENDGNFSSHDTLKYSRQILSAIGYAHSQEICNQNLNPFTVLIDKSDNVRLLGFDLINDALIFDPIFGFFIGKEIRDIHLQRGSGKKQDMWAIGALIYYMRMGRGPKDERCPFKHIPFCMKLGNHPNRRIKRVIKNLMCIAPDRRKSAEEIMEFDWFN